jgi:hypothetical protein
VPRQSDQFTVIIGHPHTDGRKCTHTAAIGIVAAILASRDFKGIRRKRLPIFMLGADHSFQASFERQTPHSPPASSVTNWREYDASLHNRGSLTIWFTSEAIAGWKAQSRTTPGGQCHYSDLAIETALTLRTVFRLALRQSEGLIGSTMKMLEIDLPVPDHTTLSRRACGLLAVLAGAEPLSTSPCSVK